MPKNRFSWIPWIYCTPILAGGYFQFLVANYLLKYATDILLLAPAFVGTVFLFSRLWDAVNDPLIGWFSDFQKKKSGKRKRLIIFSAPVLALSFLALWYSPAENKEFWFAFWLIVFFTALTFLYVPHYSLGAELSENMETRLKLFGGRTISENAGVIAGALMLTILIPLNLVREVTDSLTGVTILAAFIILLPLFFLKEPEKKVEVSVSFGESFKTVLANRQMRWLSSISFLNQIGASVMLAASLYFTEYVMGKKDLGSAVPAIFIISASICIPIWIHFGKVQLKSFWLIGQFMMTIGVGLMFFIQYLPYWSIFPASFLVGAGAGSALTYTPAVVAQISETGHDGVFFSIFTFMNKSGMAVAAFIVGQVLALTGFLANSIQSESALSGIKITFTVIPGFCFLMAALMIYVFNFKGKKTEPENQ